MPWPAVRGYRLRKPTGQCAGNGFFLTHVRSPEQQPNSGTIFGQLERELPGHSDVSIRAVAGQFSMSGPLGAGGAVEIRHGISSILSRVTLTPNPAASGTARS
jgi:hypothetical protein